MKACRCSHANMQCRLADTHHACPPPTPSPHTTSALAMVPLKTATLSKVSGLRQTPPVLHKGTGPMGFLPERSSGPPGKETALVPAAPAAEGPDHGFMPGTCLSAKELISSVPQSSSTCTAPLPATSARERPFCCCMSSQNTEPQLQLLLALSDPLYCRTESKSPLPSPYI